MTYRIGRRGDRYQRSRDRVSSAWKKAGWKYARRLGRFAAFGPGALAAAGLSNFFIKVPKMPSRDISTRAPKRARTNAPSGHTTQDAGGYVQLKYETSKRAGKRLGKRQKISKLVNSHVQPVIERFQNVTSLTSGAGAYFLDWDTSGTTYNQLPVYLMDLTCIRNRLGDNTSVAEPHPLVRMNRNKSVAGLIAGAYFSDWQDGKTQADVASRNWQFERRSVGLGSTPVAHFEKSLIEWCDIRMVLYGARKCPSFVQVMVVQFQEEDQCIGAYADVGAGSSVVETEPGRSTVATDPRFNRWNTAWQGFVDNLSGNPINTRDLQEQKLQLKVKYSRTYKFNPTLETESDKTGHQVSIKFRYDMNKVCNYVEDPRQHTEVTAANENNPNYWPSYDAHMYSPFTAPKGREFLVIRGYAGKPTALTGTAGEFVLPADRYDAACSFDLMVRRKRTHMRI